MLNEFNYLIVNRDDIKNPAKAELAQKLVPLKDTIRRVRTAYEIIAYPQCQERGRRYNIETQLRQDQEFFERDKVELNDAEMDIVRKLCETPRYALRQGLKEPQPKIPFDPQKRVYNYAEVLNAPPGKPQQPK
jgi:hypothetical protein